MAHQPDAQVYEFQAAADGSLTALGTLATGAYAPDALVAHPDGLYVYAASNSSPMAVGQYKVGAGGALTPLSPQNVVLPAPAPGTILGSDDPDQAFMVTVHPNGCYLYVSGAAVEPTGSSTPGYYIEQLSIGADGTLTTPSNTALAVPFAPAGQIAFDATGTHAYLAGTESTGSGVIGEFAVASDGQLTMTGTMPILGSVATPTNLTATPDGSTLLILAGCAASTLSICQGQVIEYSIAADGTLSANLTPTMLSANEPVSLLTLSQGAYLLANQVAPGQAPPVQSVANLFQYTLGAPAAASTVDALHPDNPPSVAVSQAGAVAQALAGHYLYVMSVLAPGTLTQQEYVDSYSIGSGGVLTPLTTSSGTTLGLPTFNGAQQGLPVAIAAVPAP